MLIDFECRNCNSDLNIDTDELLDNPKAFRCSNCRAKINEATTEQFASAVEDLMSLLQNINLKFSFSLSIDSDDEALFEAIEDDAEDWVEDEDLETEATFEDDDF